MKKEKKTRSVVKPLDKIREINKVNVYYKDKKVGELAMTPTNRCAFEYDDEWLSSGFSISPRDLPLRKELFIANAEPFYGNFGIFEDSLPDGYGRYLLNKILRKEGIDDRMLTPVQRLSIVGSSGMRALSYIPEIYIGGEKGLPELDHLQQIALDVLSEKTEEFIDVLYHNSGNSGGCRPKALYENQDGHWLVKFRHTYDPLDMGKMEYLYNKIARSCGIDVPGFKLLNDKYFATKRFDIDDNGERLHIATAGAILNQSIHLPSMDYKQLLSLTGYLTQNPVQVEQMFRRMVFNVLCENKDDHAKNFSFMYRNSKWVLSPAYDLTKCSAGYHGEHATSVNGNGLSIEEDMLTVGEGIRIPHERGKEIIDEMKVTCKSLLSERFK